jgi:hypothetical protein
MQTLQRLYLWVEVTGSNPVDSNKVLYKQPITWCHVAPYNQPNAATFRNVIRPHLPTVCHSALPHVIRTTTSAAVQIVQSTSIFFPVCHFEQNAISLAPNVCLNPNELRWVRNDEAYAPVQFEAIPSTLNF